MSTYIKLERVADWLIDPLVTDISIETSRCPTPNTPKLIVDKSYLYQTYKIINIGGFSQSGFVKNHSWFSVTKQNVDIK